MFPSPVGGQAALQKLKLLKMEERTRACQHPTPPTPTHPRSLTHRLLLPVVAAEPLAPRPAAPPHALWHPRASCRSAQLHHAHGGCPGPARALLLAPCAAGSPTLTCSCRTLLGDVTLGALPAPHAHHFHARLAPSCSPHTPPCLCLGATALVGGMRPFPV